MTKPPKTPKGIEQKKLAKSDDGHIGNTFSGACMLAQALLTCRKV